MYVPIFQWQQERGWVSARYRTPPTRDLLAIEAQARVWRLPETRVTPITKPPLLQESRLTGGGSPNLVGLVERKAL